MQHLAPSSSNSFLPEPLSLAARNRRMLMTLEAIIYKLLKLQKPSLSILKAKLQQAEKCVDAIESDSPMAPVWATKLSEWRDAYSLLKASKDLKPVSTVTIDLMPEEVTRKIFKVLTPTETLFSREVCRSWQNYIETMYIPGQHVLICFEGSHDKEELARRFFARSLDIFTKFRMKAEPFETEDFDVDYMTSISNSFFNRITCMFPNIEHLLIDTVLNIESANAIIEFLPSMTELRSFSVFKASHLPDKRKLALMRAIQSCPKIDRLGITDMGRHWYRYMNFANYKHLAYESDNKDNIEEVVRRLTPNTYSFWTSVNNLDAVSIENWIRLNPDFIMYLDMLYIGSIINVDEISRAYVNVSSFTNLYLLRIEFAYHTLPELENSYVSNLVI